MAQLQVGQGILPPDAMQRLGYGAWRSFFENPMTGCIWPNIRGGVSDDFRRYIEEGQDPNALDCSAFAIP
jgi:hypothetical protein